MPILAILSRDHSGKPAPTKVQDRGAAYDLDGDGHIHAPEREAFLTGYVSLAAEARLYELGHHVIPIADGWYSDRHARANEYARKFPGMPCVYVALHLNADTHGGGYGLVCPDYRSRKGEVVANHVATALGTIADELDAVRVVPAAPDTWTANAYATIKGLGNPIGLCYEPAFLSNPKHHPLFEMQGLRRLGTALAEGLHAWALEAGA